MKYSLTAAVLLQPPGSRNQGNRHIRLSVLKAAVLVPPQGRDSHRKHQWGRYFQAKLEEPPTTVHNDHVRVCHIIGLSLETSSRKLCVSSREPPGPS
ncbi:hypothetical protein STEG23_008724 [Scotinomys teguina]